MNCHPKEVEGGCSGGGDDLSFHHSLLLFSEGARLVDCNTNSSGACRDKHNQATTRFLSSRVPGAVLDAGIQAHRRLGGNYVSFSSYPHPQPNII